MSINKSKSKDNKNKNLKEVSYTGFPMIDQYTI